MVDRLLDFELKARHDRRVETNLKFAGLPYRQRLDTCDFDAQPSVDPQLIGRLASLSFLDEGTNVLLLGPPGVGNTALAVANSILSPATPPFTCTKAKNRPGVTAHIETSTSLLPAEWNPSDCLIRTLDQTPTTITWQVLLPLSPPSGFMRFSFTMP